MLIKIKMIRGLNITDLYNIKKIELSSFLGR